MKRIPTAMMAALIVCLSVPAFAQDSAEEKITLRLNLEKGAKKKMSYDMAMDMVVNVPQQGQQIKGKTNMGFDISAEVADVADNGELTMKMTYDRVRMLVSMGPVQLDFDSADPDKGGNNPASAALAAMVGKTITVKMTPQGKVLDIEGLDQLGPQGAGFSKLFDQMFNYFPDKPVGVGDSWEGKMKLPADGQMAADMKMVSTLKARKEGKAIIGVDATMSAKGAVSISGKMTGAMTVDEKTGWFEKGDMTMNFGGEGPGGMTMTYKGTVKMN